MTGINEEELITLVQGYKSIYDQADSDYHKTNVRENIWEEIAEQLHSTGELCLCINIVFIIKNICITI